MMIISAPYASLKVIFWDLTRTVLVLIAFYVLIYLLLDKTIGYPFGFIIDNNPEILLDAMVQAFPMVATALSLLIVGVFDNRISQKGISDLPFKLFCQILLNALIMGLLFFLTTYILVSSMYSMSAPAGSSWVWLGYGFDLFALMIFAQFIYALTRRWHLTLITFFAYVLFAMFLGTTFGDIELIGFATSPPIVLSGFTERPIGIEAAWFSRLYWGAIAIGMALILAFFDHRPSPILVWRKLKPRSTAYNIAGIVLVLIALIVAVVTAFTIDERKKAVELRYLPNADLLPVETEPLAMRATMTKFKIDVDSVSSEQIVSIQGTIYLVNLSDSPLQALAFEKSQLLQILEMDANLPSRVTKGEIGRLLVLHLQEPLQPNEKVEVNYRGKIQADDIFDKKVRTTVMKDAFFLPAAALLPLPKNSSCFVRYPDYNACRSGENYLQTDAAPGQVAISVQKGVRVASAYHLETGLSFERYVLDVPAQSLGNFLVAAARFRVTEIGSDYKVLVYTSPFGRTLSQALAEYIIQEIDLFAHYWRPPSWSSYWLIETPTNFSQAVAYYGGAAISEKRLSISAQSGTVPSAVTKMVVSHELAHQWLGFSLIPAKGPGDAFVLESFTQFAATESLRRQGLISREHIIANEQSNTEIAIAKSRDNRVPLYAITNPNWQAYHQGPLVLAQLDERQGGKVLSFLGEVIRKTATTDSTIVDPQEVIFNLVNSLPQNEQEILLKQLGITLANNQ